MIKLPLNYNKILKTLFICALSLFTILNLIKLKKVVSDIVKIKQLTNYQDIEYRFKGLENNLPKGTTYLGYFSDSDLTKSDDVKLLSQAQFVLAPVILDYTNIDHKYVLFVCNNETNAWKKMKETNTSPFLRNRYGVILGVKP